MQYALGEKYRLINEEVLESGIDRLDTIPNYFSKENIDLYIDDGKSRIGLASTIVQVIDGVPHILREGSITKEKEC